MRSRGSFRWPATHRHLRLNHYATKSREEFLERIRHGRADVTRLRSPEEFGVYQGNEVRDLSIQQYLPRLRERLHRFPVPAAPRRGETVEVA